MIDKNAIRSLIAKAKKEREELLQRAEGLNEVISYLSKQLTIETPTKQGIEREIITPASGRFENCSAPEAAEIVLQEHGKEMHVKDVVREVLKGGYKGQTNKNKLYGNLFTRMSRKPKVFKRNKRKKATFGLVDWEKKEAEG